MTYGDGSNRKQLAPHCGMREAGKQQLATRTADGKQDYRSRANEDPCRLFITELGSCQWRMMRGLHSIEKQGPAPVVARAAKIWRSIASQPTCSSVVNIHMSLQTMKSRLDTKIVVAHQESTASRVSHCSTCGKRAERYAAKDAPRHHAMTRFCGRWGH